MDAPCVLLWMKPEYESEFRKHGFAYCRAIPDAADKNIDLNLSIEVGSEFIPCGGRSHELISKGWRAKTRAARFITKDKLTSYIKSEYPTCKLRPSSQTRHYILFEFSEPVPFKTFNVTAAHKKHRSGDAVYMAVTCRWSDILNAQLTQA